VPRVAPGADGEAGHSDRLEAGQHALAAEVYAARLLAFRLAGHTRQEG
jgi:hypothetical protein